MDLTNNIETIFYEGCKNALIDILMNLHRNMKNLLQII